MNRILCATRWADDTVGHIAEWLPRNLQVDDGAAAGGIARSLNCVGRATAAEVRAAQHKSRPSHEGLGTDGNSRQNSTDFIVEGK